VCTAQSRESLCVYCRVKRGTVCEQHSIERHCVFVLSSLKRYSVCTTQCRESLYVYCTV